MAYTDLTTEFDYKDLLTYQNMDKLAENDAIDHLAQGTVKLFFQASAPVGWYKQTSFDDGAIRVVSGAGGGTGGSTAFSTGFSAIAHTHDIASHTHTIANHTHDLDYTAAAAGHTNTGTPRLIAESLDTSHRLLTEAGGGTLANVVGNTTSSGGSGTLDAATATLNSSLTNITFKYIDVLVCTKGA